MSEENLFGSGSGGDDDFIDGEELVAGDYKAVCTGVVKKNSKNSGNPMFVWTLTVKGGLTLTEYATMTPSGRAKSSQIMKALGVAAGPDGKTKARPSDLIGKECMVTVVIKNDPDYGDQAKISRFRSLGGAEADDSSIPF